MLYSRLRNNVYFDMAKCFFEFIQICCSTCKDINLKGREKRIIIQVKYSSHCFRVPNESNGAILQRSIERSALRDHLFLSARIVLSFLPALLFLAFPVVLNSVSFFVSTKGNIDFSLLIKKQMKIITKKIIKYF